MDLSPEDKAIGKENFYQAVGTPRDGKGLDLDRREFLLGAAGAGGVGLGAMYFGYDKIDKENPVRIGVIGTGDEGSVLIGALNPDYVDVVAIADIRPYNVWRAFHGDNYSPNAKKARPGLLEVYKDKHGWKNEDEAREYVEVYEDKYEDLLADENVEAVIIALPLWLHDVAAVKAMKAGKHVLTEKLMAQTVGKCKEMARVAAAEDKILATGHQRHYSILYANAVDTIKRGLIGEVHSIRAQWHRGNLPGNDSWQPPMPTETLSKKDFVALRRKVRQEKGEAAEKEMLAGKYKLVAQMHSMRDKAAIARDKGDTKLEEAWNIQADQKENQLKDLNVDASKYGYLNRKLENGEGTKIPALEELIRWRLWNRTGAGLMAELGSHQLDAASIFIAHSTAVARRYIR